MTTINDLIPSFNDLSTAGLIISEVDPQAFEEYKTDADTAFIDLIERQCRKRIVDNVEFEFDTLPQWQQKYTVASYDPTTAVITITGTTPIYNVTANMFCILLNSSTAQNYYERRISAVATSGGNTQLTLDSAFPLAAGTGAGVVGAGDILYITSIANEHGGKANNATGALNNRDKNKIALIRHTVAANVFAKDALQGASNYNHQKVQLMKIFNILRQNKLILGRNTSGLLGPANTPITEPYGIFSGMLDSYFRANHPNATPYVSNSAQAIAFSDAITMPALIAACAKISEGSMVKYWFLDNLILTHIINTVYNKAVPIMYDEVLKINVSYMKLGKVEVRLVPLTLFDHMFKQEGSNYYGYGMILDPETIVHVKHAKFPKIAAAKVLLADGYDKTTTKDELITTDSIQVSNVERNAVVQYKLSLLS